MTPSFWRGFNGLAAACLLVTSTSACMISVESGDYRAREEKRFDVKGTPEVTLVTFDGGMEIRSWDQPQVLIEIEKRAVDQATADSIEVRAEQAGQTVRLEVRKPTTSRSMMGLKVSPSARIIATVPRSSHITARTGDGSITIERIEGRVDLDTGDGGIRAYDLEGTLRARTGDGSVKLEHVNGRVDIDSGDGGASLSGKLAAVILRTGDGSVTVRAEDGSAMTDDWEIRTGDGGVRLEVPEDFAASLDASTGDGVVRVQGLGEPAGGGPDERARRELRRSLGSGGRQLRLRSGSGTITIRRL